MSTNLDIIPVRSKQKFCCPHCKDPGGYFGSFTFHDSMKKAPTSPWRGTPYKTGDCISYCTAKHHVPGNSCEYHWRRDRPDHEDPHFKRIPYAYCV